MIRSPAGEWVRDALCAELVRTGKARAEWWFPERGETHVARWAKEVCAACPVREPCLDWAVNLPETDGIWGGTSARDRKKIAGPRLRTCGWCAVGFLADAGQRTYCSDECRREARRAQNQEYRECLA